MRARGTRARCLTGAGILLALAGSVGLAGAPARSAADSVAEGVKKLVQGNQETVKGIGKTLTEGATGVEQRAKAAKRRVEARPGEAGEERPGRRRVHLGWHEVRRSVAAEVLHGQLR
jgi:hypothetical protein